MTYRILDSCRACGRCLDACPAEAIQEGEIFKINSEVCMGCGACAPLRL